MSNCNCLGVCRCTRRICYTLGIDTAHTVNCPKQCNKDCVPDVELMESSYIAIRHPCIAGNIARIDDVLEIGRCVCTLYLPATFDEIVNFKIGCDCVFTYEIWTTIKESDDAGAATCRILADSGEIYFDWSLV